MRRLPLPWTLLGAPALLATATGAHLFHLTRGEQQVGGVGGIARDPAVWGGRAVIQGTRIPVFVIVDQFWEAGNVEGVLEAYPELKAADVHVALAYAELDREAVAHDRQTYLDTIPPGLESAEWRSPPCPGSFSTSESRRRQ